MFLAPICRFFLVGCSFWNQYTFLAVMLHSQQNRIFFSYNYWHTNIDRTFRLPHISQKWWYELIFSRTFLKFSYVSFKCIECALNVHRMNWYIFIVKNYKFQTSFKGINTGSPFFSIKIILRTWNIRRLYQCDQLEMIKQEMNRLNDNMLDVCKIM